MGKTPTFEHGMGKEHDPDDGYPPEDTEETALVLVFDCDTYHVLGHRGRYFYCTCDLAGHTGQEVGIDFDKNIEPGFYVLEHGTVGSSKDWETGITDDVWVSGHVRLARMDDFVRFGVEQPIEHPGAERLPDASTRYMLRYVPPDRVDLARECGFIPFGSGEENVLWFAPRGLKGPIAEEDPELRRWWLMRKGMAGQIFVADMWGAGPD